MTSELKPCPFCGSEAEMVESDYGMYLTGYAVYCRKCCLKMGVTGRLGETYEWTPVFNTGAEAIAAWNTRAEQTCRDTNGGGYTFKCSNCNYVLHMPFGWNFSYCPNCGAKVVE